MDVWKALRRGIFVSTNDSEKTRLSFKYENFSVFCFGYRRMGHNVKECEAIPSHVKEKGEVAFPYSVTLRAESKLLGKECMQFV